MHVFFWGGTEWFWGKSSLLRGPLLSGSGFTSEGEAAQASHERSPRATSPLAKRSRPLPPFPIQLCTWQLKDFYMVVVGKHFTFLLLVVWGLKSLTT